jgi:hypothetical protein
VVKGGQAAGQFTFHTFDEVEKLLVSDPYRQDLVDTR